MVADEMWNHLETERKVSIELINGTREHTRWVDGCRGEVGCGRDGNVGRVIPRGVSGRVGVGDVAAESGMSNI